MLAKLAWTAWPFVGQDHLIHDKRVKQKLLRGRGETGERGSCFTALAERVKDMVEKDERAGL